MKIKVNGCKKYDTDRGWVVVVYVDLVNEGDKAELVWPEFGKPFFQQITKTDESVKIARMVLSSKPYVADDRESRIGHRFLQRRPSGNARRGQPNQAEVWRTSHLLPQRIRGYQTTH